MAPKKKRGRAAIRQKFRLRERERDTLIAPQENDIDAQAALSSSGAGPSRRRRASSSPDSTTVPKRARRGNPTRDGSSDEDSEPRTIPAPEDRENSADQGVEPSTRESSLYGGNPYSYDPESESPARLEPPASSTVPRDQHDQAGGTSGNVSYGTNGRGSGWSPLASPIYIEEDVPTNQGSREVPSSQTRVGSQPDRAFRSSRRRISLQSAIDGASPIAPPGSRANHASMDSEYRQQVLGHANVFIHDSPPNGHILTQINAILESSISQMDEENITGFSESFHDSFVAVYDELSHDNLVYDDCVEAIHDTLLEIGGTSGLAFGRDELWRQDVAPRINIPHPMVSRHDGATLRVMMPQPSITVGISRDTVRDMLKIRGDDDEDSEALKAYLNRLNKVRAKSAGVNGANLEVDPCRRTLGLSLPFLLVHSTTYRGGIPIYNVQNRAAMSGACAIEIQQSLAEKAGSKGYRNKERELPLAFAICNEGPLFELWACYHVSEWVDKCVMSIVNSCHAGVLETVRPFLAAVFRVMKWGTTKFLDTTVEQLYVVARTPDDESGWEQ